MTLLMRRLGREAARAILADRLPALPAELAGAQPITDVMFTYSSVGGPASGTPNSPNCGDAWSTWHEAMDIRTRPSGCPSSRRRLPGSFVSPYR